MINVTKGRPAMRIGTFGLALASLGLALNASRARG